MTVPTITNDYIANAVDNAIITWDFTATAGRLILCAYWKRDGWVEPIPVPTGYTLIDDFGGTATFTDGIAVFAKDAAGGESGFTFPDVTGGATGDILRVLELDGGAVADLIAAEIPQTTANPLTGSITPDAGVDALLFAFLTDSHEALESWSVDSSWTILTPQKNNHTGGGSGNGHPIDVTATRGVTNPSGSYSIVATIAAGHNKRGILVAVKGDAPVVPPVVPDVEFSVDGVKFDNLLEARVRFELNAPGAGYMVLSKGDAQAIPSMVYRGALVQCTFPEIHSGVLFEFYLEEGDFDVISGDEEGGEELRFGGPGTLSVLRRAIVRSEEYLDGIGYPKPNKGVWVFDEGNTEGHIINKLIREAQAPARPAHPLAGVTKTFDADDDSNGQSWHDQELEGKWRVKIGANLYDAVLRLVNSGLLFMEMRPGLVLYARRTTGTDRTTGSFAPGKVRFVKGENIADELTKSLAGQYFATHAEVKYLDNDDDVHYINATKDAGDFSYDKEMYLEVEASHANTARRQAKHAMKLREDLQDAIELAHKVPWPGKISGDPASDDITDKADEENGWYLPGASWTDHGSYWLGDVITLHTGLESDGASDFEWQNRHKRVYAITLEMDPTGHLAPPIVELNAPKAKSNNSVLQGISGTLSATGTGGSTGGGGSGSGGIPTIVDGALYQPIAEKGDADGYAGLDADGHVPAAQMGDESTGDGFLVLHDDGVWRPVSPLSAVKLVDPATGVVALDYALGPVWDLVLSGDVDLSTAVANVPPDGLHVKLGINVYGDGTHTVTDWPAAFEWQDTDGSPTSTPPALFTAPDSRSVVEAVTHDGGVTWGAALVNAASTGGAGATFGTPAIVLGTVAAAGSIDEVIRRDSTIVAFDGTAPVTQAMGDAAATGSAAVAARRDHKHGMPAFGTTAAAIGTSAGGSATTPSKSDHVHATGAGTPSTQAFGDAASTGTGPAAAMTDHKHAMPANPVPAHEAASDPHTVYRLEAADHSHASSGLQGGRITAASVDVVDAGGSFSSGDVEGVLAELAGGAISTAVPPVIRAAAKIYASRNLF